jgi:hypothetical protein
MFSSDLPWVMIGIRREIRIWFEIRSGFVEHRSGLYVLREGGAGTSEKVILRMVQNRAFDDRIPVLFPSQRSLQHIMTEI